ncbi:MAG: ATP synthase gamma chain [Candidatus Parcubacteria bacterium]|nr:MAG: ATP synthase gamma chain [Candidatus Parcubacteria bacterium]
MKSKNLIKIRKQIRFLINFQKTSKSISLISSIKFQKVYRKISKIMRNVFYLLAIFKEILKHHPHLALNIIKANPKGKILVVVVGSDKGLAGLFDQSIFKETENFLKDKDFYLGTIGSKPEKYFKRKYQLLFSFSKFENILPESFAQELLSFFELIINENKINQIYLIRPNLTSVGFQVEVIKIFPLTLDALEDLIEKIKVKTKEFGNLQLEESLKNFEYILEPSPQVLTQTIFNQISYLIIYALILQSQASLEFVRTITMKKASENAEKIKEKEILGYNKLRQQKITEELLDLRR